MERMQWLGISIISMATEEDITMLLNWAEETEQKEIIILHYQYFHLLREIESQNAENHMGTISNYYL